MTQMETMPNKALSGAEIKAIILEKFKFMLSQNTRLADYVAYGRLSYDVTLRLHLDNIAPVVDVIASAPIGKNIVEAMPELEAIEAGPPLKNASPESVTTGARISHDIDNPNLERLTHNLAVPVDAKKPDGTVITEEVHYPIDYPIEKQKNVRLEDLNEVTAKELGK